MTKDQLTDLEQVFRDLTAIASKYRWFTTGGGKIRARVHQQELCPLQVLGFDKSGRKEIPDTKMLGASAGVSDRTAAIMVHLVDDHTSSPHYQAGLRQRLLEAVGLNPAKKRQDA